MHTTFVLSLLQALHLLRHTMTGEDAIDEVSVSQ